MIDGRVVEGAVVAEIASHLTSEHNVKVHNPFELSLTDNFGYSVMKEFDVEMQNLKSLYDELSVGSANALYAQKYFEYQTIKNMILDAISKQETTFLNVDQSYINTVSIISTEKDINFIFNVGYADMIGTFPRLIYGLCKFVSHTITFLQSQKHVNLFVDIAISEIKKGDLTKASTVAGYGEKTFFGKYY